MGGGTIKEKMMNGKSRNMMRSGEKEKNNELEEEYEDKMTREQRR
jgi:hypothetical protein